MKHALFYTLLSISYYLFIYIVFSSRDGSLKHKMINNNNNNDDKMSMEEKVVREIFECSIPRIIKPLVDIILDYNQEIVWRTKRVDPSEIKDIEFEIGEYDLFINISSDILDPITSNGRKLFYDKGSRNF